ncbi:AMP-binding protein [Microbacterium lacticum]
MTDDNVIEGLPGATPWASVPALLESATTSEQRSGGPFLWAQDRQLSLAELGAEVGRFAATLLRHGVEPGDRVAIRLPNVSWWPVAWLATLSIGAVAVPASTQLQRADLRHILADSGARIVVTERASVELVHDADPTAGTTIVVLVVEDLPISDDERFAGAELHGDTVANLQYTSGTTGFPKGCVLTHDYWLRTAWHVAQAAAFDEHDVLMMSQPFSYMDQQWMLLAALMSGARFVSLPKFSASGFWEAARDHGATVTYVLGSMPTLLAKQPEHPRDRESRMRLVLCSGIEPQRHAEFEERWGTAWREIYGSTESGLDLMVPPAAVESVGSGILGTPPPGKVVRVVDEQGREAGTDLIGRLAVDGLPMFRGYWNDPEATDRVLDGTRYDTGDLGYRDQHGGVHHAGRAKDVIRRGGENISAAEVEAVLREHPAVVDAAVIGAADPVMKEVPKAFVQVNDSVFEPITARELFSFAAANLAKFKVPQTVEFIDSFERTPSERIRKSLLSPAIDPAPRRYARDSRVAVELMDGVAVVRIDRPEKLNALNAAMRSELAVRIREWGDGSRARGIVVTGEGRAFSAGADLTEAAAGTAGDLRHEVDSFNDLTRAVLGTRVPVVGAINGIAVGGASEWSLSFDARIGSPSTVYFLPENAIGLTISNASSVLLRRLIGSSRALDFVLRARRVDADNARALGLIDVIVSPEELIQQAVRTIHSWTPEGGATALHLALLRPSSEEIEEAMDREARAAMTAGDSGIAASGIARAGFGGVA